jgi:hypothetical protein
MRPVDVRQGSLPGMAMPEMFMSVLSSAERNPRQVDVAVLAISPEFFRKLGLREEVKCHLLWKIIGWGEALAGQR